MNILILYFYMNRRKCERIGMYIDFYILLYVSKIM